MTKKELDCENNCTHKTHDKPNKRKMGTSKKKEEKKIIHETVPDDIIMGTVIGEPVSMEEEMSWINVAENNLQISNEDPMVSEIKELQLIINSSNLPNPKEECKFIIEECQRKLLNLRNTLE